MNTFAAMDKSDSKKEKKRISKESRKKAKRILRYFRPHRSIFMVGFVFLILSSAISTLFPELMGRLVVAGNLPRDTSDPIWELNSINSIALVMVIVFALQAIFSFVRVYVFSYVTERALKSLRAEIFTHILKLPMSFFDQRQVGELNSRISADITLLQDTFITTIAELIRQIMIILVCGTLITLISWKLTLMIVASLPPMILLAVIFGRFIKKLSNQVQEEIADSNIIVQEAYSGISNVKSFANENYERKRYSSVISNVLTLGMKRAKWRSSFISFILLFMMSTIALVVWYGAVLQSKGDIEAEDMSRFIMLAVFVGASFGSLPDLYSKLVKAIGATEHLMDLMDETSEAVNPEYTPVKLQGKVEFKDLDFHYPSRPDLQVLHKISFQVEPGEQIAVVGSSGAGKSTIASLILRFYDPSSGSILFDGKEHLSYDLSALRSEMAIVPQEVMLFGGSIRENIAYGKPGASEEEIIEAARKANAHDFITEFPDRYETAVGDRGIQLSGGQRQRVAIARAILNDPTILILDEATSSLDSESEMLVQDALTKLMKGRTSFVIAHRLSTIRNADKILVLHKGKLVEIGKHDELFAQKDSIYHKLCTFQFINETTEA